MRAAALKAEKFFRLSFFAFFAFRGNIFARYPLFFARGARNSPVLGRERGFLRGRRAKGRVFLRLTYARFGAKIEWMQKIARRGL